MDAHVFRRLGLALSNMLMGARLEKIQSPADNIYALSFYAQKTKQYLIFKASRREPFLYISKQRPTVGTAPSAQIMRLRKHCAGKRVADCTVDWLNRRLLLLFSSGITDSYAEKIETWLILDLRAGPSLVLGKCPPLPEENIEWPSEFSIIDDESWRAFPILTPALRRTLTHLDDLDQRALLMDLEVGGGDIFVYGEDMESELYAWPLPKALIANRHEQIYEDPILATSSIGDMLVLGGAAKKERDDQAAPHKREMLRLQRLLEKLDAEQLRLQELVAMKERGLCLQKIMWQYAADTKMQSIEVDDYGIINLDPRHTLSDNMQIFFNKAGKGQRGLVFLQARRAKVQEQIKTLNSVVHGALAGNVNMQQRVKAKNEDRPNLVKGVEYFYSSDNFVILRGKDAKGNWAALRMAAAQDLWLHVEGGPGAHCIIRRHFAGQEIPEKTLHEAAKLAAIKSWQKDNPYAQIISAEVRHVKPMRNAAPGMVRIDKVWQSFRVAVETSIESSLSV